MELIRQQVAAKLTSIIRHQYRDFDVQVAQLDSRLKLARCDQDLSVFPLREPLTAGSLAVGVRCAGSHPWTIYIKAKIRAYRPVVVTTQAVPRGAVVGKGAVALKRAEVGALPRGYFTEIEAVVGQQALRSLPQGRVLAPRFLGQAKVIRKGDKVMIQAQSPILDVRMGGVALTDGGLGQRIRVRNERSKRMLEAVVQGPGKVVVPF